MEKMFVKTVGELEYNQAKARLKDPFPTPYWNWVDNEAIYINLADPRESSVTNPSRYPKEGCKVCIISFDQFKEASNLVKVSDSFKLYERKYRNHPLNVNNPNK